MLRHIEWKLTAVSFSSDVIDFSPCTHHIKSKDIYGQTRGLSNLEMKHVGELAITGGFVPCKIALISQSVGFFRWLLLYIYYKHICPE